MEPEELVFGGDDPGHEPGFGPWAAAHTKLLTVCAAVLVVLGLAGAGGWYLYERSWLPQPPPDVALSPSLEFEVAMCGCPGLTSATVEQRQEAEAMLRAMPQVTSVKVRSGQELADQWRRSYEGIGDTRRAGSSILSATSCMACSVASGLPRRGREDEIDAEGLHRVAVGGQLLGRQG